MKRQIVSVDFKEDEGVILNWNLSDVQRKSKYFRHFIILLTSNMREAQSFAQNYIKGIKPGDLFALVCQPPQQCPKMRQWREKTYNHHFSFRNYINCQSIEIFNFPQALRIIQNALQQIDEPAVINFVVERQAQVDALGRAVADCQKEGKMTFINSIFCPNRANSLSVSSGIHLLDLHDSDMLDFYHQHVNQAALEYARLTITCRNGELSSCEQGDWKNVGFSRIQRCYYAPTAKYSRDILHIINTKMIYSGSYELDIGLTYKCFNGVLYSSEKKIVINFNHSEFYNRTVAVPRRKRAYITAEDVQLTENPYSSETIVCFEKQIGEKDVDEETQA